MTTPTYTPEQLRVAAAIVPVGHEWLADQFRAHAALLEERMPPMEKAMALETEWTAKGEALNIDTSAHIRLLRELAAAQEARQRAEEGFESLTSLSAQLELDRDDWKDKAQRAEERAERNARLIKQCRGLYQVTHIHAAIDAAIAGEGK